MASLKRLSADTIRAKYWDERLAYYRKLLAAHGVSFWPARFAATALGLMAKNLTKATDVSPQDASEEGSKSIDESTDGLLNAFTSPETSWSGFSYDFFPHNLTEHLNDADFSTDWTSIGRPDGFQFQ